MRFPEIFALAVGVPLISFSLWRDYTGQPQEMVCTGEGKIAVAVTKDGLFRPENTLRLYTGFGLHAGRNAGGQLVAMTDSGVEVESDDHGWVKTYESDAFLEVPDDARHQARGFCAGTSLALR